MDLYKINSTKITLNEKDLFKATFLDCFDSIVVTDSKFNIVNANKSFLDKFNLSLDNIFEYNISNFFEIQNSIINFDKKVVIETSVNKPNGNSFPAKVRVKKLNKEADLFLFKIIDISLTKEKDQIFSNKEAELKAIFDSTKDKILSLNKSLEVVSFNKSFEKLFYLVTNEKPEIGVKISERDFLINNWKELIDSCFNDKNYEIEKSFKVNKNLKLYFKLQFTPIKLKKSEEIIGVTVYIKEITNIKRIEKELVNQRDYLMKIIDLNQSFIYIKDYNGKFKLANESVTNFINKDLNEIIGKKDSDINNNFDEANRFHNTDLLVIKNKTKIEKVEKLTSYNGEKRWFQTLKTPIFDEENNVIEVLGISNDITDLIQTKNKLEKALKSLSEAQKISKICSWEYDPYKNKLEYSNYYSCKLFEPIKGEVFETPKPFLNFLNKIANSKNNKKEYKFTFSIKEKKHFQVICRKTFDEKELIKISGTIQDVTERIHSENQEENYKSLFENNLLAISICNMKGELIEVNQAFCNLLGYSREELKKLKINDLTLKSSKKLTNQNMKNLRQGHISNFTQKKSYISKCGKIIDTEVNVSAIYNKLGEIIKSIAIINNITDKKLLEEKYKDIFENINETIVTLDENGNLTNYNNAAYKLLEIPKTEEISFKIQEIIYEKDKEKSDKYFKQLIEKGFYNNYQGRIITKKGNIKHIEVNSTAIYDQFGNFSGSRDIVRDITIRKNAEKALKDSEQKYHSLFENAFDGIILVDLKNQELIGYNEKIFNYFGYEDIKSENISYFLFNITFDKFEDYYNEVKKTGKSTFKSYYVNYSNTTYFQITMLKLYQDNNYHLAILFKDITTETKVNEALKKAFSKYIYKNEAEFFNNITLSINDLIPNCSINISKYLGNGLMETKSIISDGVTFENIKYELEGTPCKEVVLSRKEKIYNNDVKIYFPKNEIIAKSEYKSYIGAPIIKSDENIFGCIAILSKSNMNKNEVDLLHSILQIFSKRIASEIERMENIKEIFKHKEKYLALYNNSSLGIAVCNDQSELVNVNDTFCKMLGYNNEEFENLSIIDITHKDEIEESKINMEKLINKEITNFSMMKKYIRKDRSILNGNVFVTGLYDQNGNYKESISLLEDITEIKEKEKKLKEYSFANSHKLRAPLANILSAVELLKGIPEAKEYTKYLDISAKELDKVIKDINRQLGQDDE